MPSRRWFILLLAVACARELPSTTPLGTGPLAGLELDAGSPGPAVDAGPDVSVEAAPPAAREASAAASDAGADADADAGDAADADAADAASEAAAKDAGPAALALAGEYAGEDVTITEVSPFPKATERDPNARLRVTQPGPSQLVFVIVDSSNGQDLCSFKAKLSGSSATLDPGQSCDAFGPVTRIERGSATFTGAALTLELHGTIEAATPQQTFRGTFDYTFKGKRR